MNYFRSLFPNEILKMELEQNSYKGLLNRGGWYTEKNNSLTLTELLKIFADTEKEFNKQNFLG